MMNKINLIKLIFVVFPSLSGSVDIDKPYIALVSREGTVRYAGLLLASAERFGLCPGPILHYGQTTNDEGLCLVNFFFGSNLCEGFLFITTLV